MIRVIRVGNISDDFVELVESTAREFYSRTGGEPELVEIYIYQSTSRMNTIMVREAAELGIPVLGDFIVMHEAWRGWPRIHVDYERCSSLKPDVVKSLLLHELAHSKLHGSPYYYVLRVDESILETYGLKALEVIYLASTVIKDLEVLMLLRDTGYEGSLEAYRAYVEELVSSVKCIDAIDLLELSKLIAPHAIMGVDVTNLNLDNSCKRYVGIVRDVVCDLVKSRLSLDEGVRVLIEKIRGITGGGPLS